MLKAENEIKNTPTEYLKDYGWGTFIQNLQVIDVPGKHNDLFNEANFVTTTQAIKTALLNSF